MYDARTMVIAGSLFTIMLGAGCDGRVLAAGNLLLATVPCALLWITINLSKAG